MTRDLDYAQAPNLCLLFIQDDAEEVESNHPSQIIRDRAKKLLRITIRGDRLRYL